MSRNMTAHVTKVSFAFPSLRSKKRKGDATSTSLLSVTVFKVDLQMTSSIPALDGLWAWNRQGIQFIARTHFSRAASWFPSRSCPSCCAGFFASHAQLHRTSCSHEAHMMQTLRSTWWSCSTSFPCRHLQSIHHFSLADILSGGIVSRIKNGKTGYVNFNHRMLILQLACRKWQGESWIVETWNAIEAALTLHFKVASQSSKTNETTTIRLASHFIRSPNSQPVNQIAWNFFSVRRGLLEKQCNTINTQTNPTALLRRCAVLKLNWDNWDLALTTWDETKPSNTGWLFRWAEM